MRPPIGDLSPMLWACVWPEMMTVKRICSAFCRISSNSFNYSDEQGQRFAVDLGVFRKEMIRSGERMERLFGATMSGSKVSPSFGPSFPSSNIYRGQNRRRCLKEKALDSCRWRCAPEPRGRQSEAYMRSNLRRKDHAATESAEVGGGPDCGHAGWLGIEGYFHGGYWVV